MLKRKPSIKALARDNRSSSLAIRNKFFYKV